MSLLTDIASATNPFGSTAQGKWAISPAVWIDAEIPGAAPITFFYENRSGDKPATSGVITAVDQITDTGSRRLAVYEYPYLDGQKVKDLGRKGETYSFNVKFFGPKYQQKLKEFRDNVYLPGHRGKLSHPVLSAIRGVIECRLQSFEPVHRAEESNAVTFRAVFVEDNSSAIDAASTTKDTQTPETGLQSALKTIVSANANISNDIALISGAASIPAAVVAAVKARQTSIMSQVSGLLGQLASTFSSKGSSVSTLAQSQGVTGGVTGIISGVLSTRTLDGSTQLVNVPPAFQVGLDVNTQAFLQAQINNFVNANTITTQQAVSGANQSRSSITAAISEVQSTFGNDGYDIELNYRTIAVTIQETVEACVTAAESQVKVYTLPRDMSLRAIAFANGLDPDRCVDIDALNPYLPSINLIPAKSVVVVPAS